MPPKVKISKEKIIEAAISLIRNGGVEAVNARTLAAALGCSTQPIFSNFETMEALQNEVLARAHQIYMDFLKNEAERKQYPEYKAFGMAYIRFAKEEKELFKLLFMRSRKGKNLAPTADFNESVQMIMQKNEIKCKEKAELIHLEIWSCVHGIATMFATSFLELDWEFISNMLTDVYLGITARHTAEAK